MASQQNQVVPRRKTFCKIIIILTHQNKIENILSLHQYYLQLSLCTLGKMIKTVFIPAQAIAKLMVGCGGGKGNKGIHITNKFIYVYL